MNVPTIQNDNAITLPALIDRAVAALANARTAAEVLEARDLASNVYDAAKKAARLSKAKGAADDLIKTAYRVQADALDIEASAKRRLADEYDAAQERKEVKANGGARNFTVKEPNSELPSAADIGLSRTDIHESRMIRDVEKESPGIIRKALDKMLESGEEPTKAKVRRVVMKAPKKKTPNRKPKYTEPEETQHDRDLRMLLGVWEVACVSSREAFLEVVSK